ncbi:hypothetical protein MTR67_048406 [Solanum verrucosum]|uniref:Chromo domain-containing protein n=1 Tax=Solanum verrucosum TaxID=315347 RepID=A0AAF0ZXC6_SOLVR|nr:hypothetical protein MTR67_048406 [Solanum verrucosum]
MANVNRRWTGERADRRMVRKLRTKEVASVKVLWRNKFVEEATWEAEEDMKKRYPHLFEPGEIPDQGENDKEGVCITANVALPKVAPPMKLDNAKEGDKTTLEDSHGKEEHLISHDNIFTNLDNFDLFSPIEGLDNPFLQYGIENDDFEDA